MSFKCSFYSWMCLAFFGSLFFCSTLKADNTIKWALSRYDPYIIVEGPDKGKGILDEIQNLFKDNLKEYRHDRYPANVIRIEDALRNGENVCAQMLKTPERETFLYFTTLPITITPSAAIVVKKRDLGKFGNAKAISLDEVIAKDDIVLGIIKSRSYGTGIDRILKAHEGRSNIYVRIAGDIYQGLFQMLMEGRVDMIIGTPVETYYLAKMMGFEKDIAIIRIAEANDYNMGCTAPSCSDRSSILMMQEYR